MSSTNGNGVHHSPAGDTRIALILDRSGSMAAIRDHARSAFNEAVERVTAEAKAGSGSVTLSLLTFNEHVHEVLVNEPAGKVRTLRPQDYQPGGSTALFDAVGRGIDLLQRPGDLAARDGALVIVITDGYENASQHVSHADLVERMQTLEATDQWTFTFMCANVDIKDLTRNLGLQAANVAAFQQTPTGVASMSYDVAHAVSDYMLDRRAGRTAKKDFYKKTSNQAATARTPGR